MRYLTFALAKGRLADMTLETLKKVGIAYNKEDYSSRQLIFENPEEGYRFFLAKAGDVPTYVEHGAADIGIVGADTIIEENRNVCEILDFKFGRCDLCIAGPPASKAKLEDGGLIRVATKYPNIAKKYFDDRNRKAEIIKLNGSVELGAIVGLADVILDIVETGSTLRENGLEVLVKTHPLSAKMIINNVSMKLQNQRISAIVQNLRTVLEEE